MFTSKSNRHLCAKDNNEQGRCFRPPRVRLGKKVLARLSVCASALLQHKQPDQQPSIAARRGERVGGRPPTPSLHPNAPSALAAMPAHL